MKYCMNCGKQLPDDAKFCIDCGTPVNAESSKRRVEQAGTVYKCPNCGEVLDSMTAVCPACGYEIRNAKATTSVKSFADQLAKIEAEEMPVVENNSFMKKVFGRDLRETPARMEEARRTFEKQKRDKKISLISNYPVPNTKEDLTEFALLVTTNLKDSSDDEVYAAWVGKLEQLYQKAEILIPTDPMFTRIEDLYLKAKGKARRKKLLPILLILGPLAVCFLIIGFASNPTLTWVILGVLIVLGIGGIVLSKQKRQNRRRH